LKNYPICADNSPSALHQWYTHFTAHAHSCGYFITPYELLHNIHGGMLGFEFGVDLPLDRQSDCYHCQTDIRNLLLESKMFQTNSEYARRVQSSTNGCHALMNLIHDSHPNYVSSLISLAPDWPHQKKDKTLHDFYNRFTETHKLRATFLQDIQDIGTDMMINIFIHRCSHRDFLTSISCLHCRDPKNVPLFKPGVIAITLNNYLLEPHSKETFSLWQQTFRSIQQAFFIALFQTYLTF
jgi:hypothetical protein